MKSFMAFIVGASVGAGTWLGISTTESVNDWTSLQRALDLTTTALACGEEEYAILLAGQITEYLGTRIDGGRATSSTRMTREGVFQQIIIGDLVGNTLPCGELTEGAIADSIVDMMVLTEVEKGEKI